MYTFLSRRKVIDTPPAHLKAHEGENQQNAESLAGTFPEKSQMYISHIAQPCNQSPCLFRIPAPVMSPSLLSPKRSGQHSESQECHTYIYKCVSSIKHIMSVRKKSRTCKEKCTSEKRVREHVDCDMRDEPRTLQRRHQCLVMYFRLKDVYQNEYSRKNSRERQYPFILPSYICE